MKLPDGIDPATPVGELTDEQIASIAGAFSIQKRWANATPEQRAEHGRKSVATRKRNLTPEQISENCRKGGLARARKAGQKIKEE